MLNPVGTNNDVDNSPPSISESRADETHGRNSSRHRSKLRHSRKNVEALKTFKFVEIFQRQVPLPFGNEVRRKGMSLDAKSAYPPPRVRHSETDSESTVDRHERTSCNRNESPSIRRLNVRLWKALDCRTYLLTDTSSHWDDEVSRSVVKGGKSSKRPSAAANIFLGQPYFYYQFSFST